MLKWILIDKGKDVHIITYEPLNTIQHQVCTICDSSLFNITKPLEIGNNSNILNIAYLLIPVLWRFAFSIGLHTFWVDNVMHVVDIEQQKIFLKEEMNLCS